MSEQKDQERGDAVEGGQDAKGDVPLVFAAVQDVSCQSRAQEGSDEEGRGPIEKLE